MPTVREYESALDGNPADTAAFMALRKAYRQGKQHDRLITLYEKRAQFVEDGTKAAELFYLASELRLDQLGDVAGAEADLANAVHRDPNHIRAAARLKDLYREQGRTTDYMEMLEMEAAAVSRTREPARIAELQSEMSQLFVSHFAALERTVRTGPRPSKLSADDVRSIELARKIYRALGDYRSVVRLYDLELEGTSEPRRRADLLLGLSRVLAEKLEELDAAAQRLTEVIRLRPRDDKALELLASVYANPNWIGADGAERAASIYHQVARRRQEAGDIESAIAVLRRALAAVPAHAEAADLIERIYYDAGRLQDLDRYYRERIQAATAPEEQINFLYKRAQLAEGDLGDLGEAKAIYAEIAAREAPGGPAGERLAELYGQAHEYAKLAELRETQLGAVDVPSERVRLMAELASLYAERLGDRDQAAVYLHAILQLEPGHPQALSAYADHFRDKNDWSALADLLEFAFEQARATQEPAELLVRRLEEIAVVTEKNLGDGARALSAWERVEEIAPQEQRARDMQKRILLKSKSFDRIVPVLEREAGLTDDPAEKIEILRRVAQIHREKLGAPERALQIYADILQLSPQDQVALRAMVEIYERGSNFEGLASTLRLQVEAAASKQERVSLLRRLLAIYDERLDDVDATAWSAQEILQLVPGDRDTLTRLEKVLERAQDHAGLVQTLDYHAEHTATQEERVQVLSRAAETLMNHLSNPAGAAARWEEVIRLDPDDGRALDALIIIYGQLEQHSDLARILDAEIAHLVGTPRKQAEFLQTLAELAELELGDQPRAQQAWEARLELLPSDPAALEALARLYAETEEWGALVRILDRQLPQVQDPAQAIALALRRAELLDSKLHDPGEAIRVLEQIIADRDPRHWEAHERLRALYAREGNWASLVGVAERQLFLTDAAEDRLHRALEIGALWRDKLKDHAKAIAAFARSVEIQPRSLEGLTALQRLHEGARDWKNVVAVDERILAQTEEAGARQTLMHAIASICDEELRDPQGAFGWYRRAHDEQPDVASWLHLDAFADRHGLFEELIDVYAAAQRDSVDPAVQVATASKIAALCEDKLDDPARAFTVLRAALPADPSGWELVPQLERLGELTGNWSGLLEVYALAATMRPQVSERVRLSHLRAEIREQHLADPSGALDELIRSFAMSPGDQDTQHEILRLANVTGRWEDALKVQAQLFALAEDLPTKIAVARHAAILVESEVKDLVRAFRAYLNAFRLAPDDEDIARQLWRLAAQIGRYGVSPTRPSTPAPAPATTPTRAPPPVSAGERASDQSGENRAARQDSPARSSAAAGIPADISSAEDTVPFAIRSESAVEESGSDDWAPGAESADDAGAVVEDSAVLSSTADVESSGVLEEVAFEELDLPDDGPTGGRHPPPSPPPAASPPPLPRPRPGGGGGRVARPFESPWEEFAQAYESLPAGDSMTRLRYLMKQAEVWEIGQKDVDRSLRVLDRAFHLAPAEAVVRAELERVARVHNRWDEVCAIYLAGIEYAPVEQAVGVHLDVARFREALGQIDKAEERYQAIVNLRPYDAVALAHLERIMRSQERWPELADILERRTSGLEPLGRGLERRDKLRELASLYEHALEKPYEAIDTLEELVAESGGGEPEGIGAAGGATTVGVSDGGAAEAAAAAGDESHNLNAEVIAACEALTRLYGRVGMWAKVVDTLEREAEFSTDAATKRLIRMRIANVHEHELGHADRAIDSLEAVRDANPADTEVLAALDRLYEANGRWDALQETLGERAALVEGGSERLELVRRRARILEDRLRNPEAAAAALRALGGEVLEDRDLSAALVRNLRRAGFGHEAARALNQVIEGERARSPGAAPEALVSLYLELASVRADDLGDAPGAHHAIAQALSISSEDPGALAALARIALKENDFVTYAATRRREARGRVSAAEAVSALLDAGRVYREQASSPAEARACFEEALARDPASVDALQALASLHAAAGEWPEARDRLLRQLELVEAPESKAAVLTDLARAVWEGSADVAGAQAYLDQALELAPGHLPAVLTAADIYYRENQWAAAERRLTEAIRRLRGQPEQSSRLYLRLAEVSDRLGRLEDSYRQLSESDRLAPAQLGTRLALGENRFRAGKWREAISYLTPLADHPEAARQAESVAGGLAHAAQAETQLRRPERALALYETAVALRPSHAISLRALAELALERGDKDAARGYLERLVAAEGDRELRVGVLERLGDLYVEAGERARGRETYESAITLFDRPTEVLVSVLEKSLRMQQEADDFEAAARSANLLIELVKDPKERARRRREAAMMIAAHGEGKQALELLESAFADDPSDDSVLTSLCDLLTRKGKQKQVVKRLGEILPTLPPPEASPAARERRANLWERLGEARRRRFPVEAIAAFENVIRLDPARQSARIALAALYDRRVEYQDAALANLRLLVEDDPGRAESVRALGEAFMARDMIDPARCAFELLEVLGGLTDSARNFLRLHPGADMKPDDPYAALMDEGDRAALVGDEAGTMSEVFNLLWEGGAPQLLNHRLEDWGITAEDKLSPVSDMDIARIYGQVAKAIGNKRTVVYIKKDARLTHVEIVVQTPPALVFGAALAEMPSAEARFEIARGLELSRPEFILGAAVKPKQFTEYFGTVLRAFHPRHAKRRATSPDLAGEHAASLRKNVPYKVSKRLAEIFHEFGATAWSSVKWRKVVAEAGNRAGLLAAGDLRAALPAFLRANKLTDGDGRVEDGEIAVLIAHHEILRDWLRFSVSDGYFRLRDKLGTAAIRAAAA